jgi:flagellar basal-body rod protein FlgF/flagellar basal-body rod protein FlgG
MENALLIGLSRQMILHREIDVVANNIANLNTSGFKSDGAIFEEFLMPGAREGQLSGRDSRVSFVQDRSTWHDMSQGPLAQTGNSLDVAVDGNAFFVVQTPRGERYTRNGAFMTNATGQLVTSEGYQVLGDAGPIVFQEQDKDINISREGTIGVPGGIRGKLRLVSFANGQRLQKDGGSTFAAPADLQPEPAQNATVVQGTIEKSNVRAVVEMARMIEITRSYSQVASLLEKQSDLRRNAIERLAEVPA